MAARKLAAGLPRGERLRIDSLAAELSYDLESARNALVALAAFRPGDLESGVRLADLRVRLGETAGARATLDRLSRLPEFTVTYDTGTFDTGTVPGFPIPMPWDIETTCGSSASIQDYNQSDPGSTDPLGEYEAVCVNMVVNCTFNAMGRSGTCMDVWNFYGGSGDSHEVLLQCLIQRRDLGDNPEEAAEFCEAVVTGVGVWACEQIFNTDMRACCDRYQECREELLH